MIKNTILSLSDTHSVQIGNHVGSRLKGGEIIQLIADIGGGKTTFVKGIASGAGSDELVTSPTFTISNIYKGKKITLNHYDFYRIGELGLMKEELREILNENTIVSLIEWARESRKLLPANRTLSITFKLVANDQNQRQLIFEYNRELSYLVDGLNFEVQQ